MLRGAIEAVLGTLERQCVGPPLVLFCQPQGQPDQESGVSQHVGHGGAGGQGAHLDPQMPARRRVVDGPVPAPHGALVQPQLVQRRCLPPRANGRWARAEHRQQRLMQPDAFGEQLQRPATEPARPQRGAGQPTTWPVAWAIVHRLLEQGDPCLLPEPVAKKRGRVAGHSQNRCRG